MKQNIYIDLNKIFNIPISKSNLATDVENCFSLKSFNRSLQLLSPPSSTIIIFGDGKSKVLFSNIVCIACPTSSSELK